MKSQKMSSLKLDQLHERHIGLTVSIAGTFTEAASVCLSRHHSSPVELAVVYGIKSSNRQVEFVKPSAHTLNAWANDIDTTESGAYGICLAAVEAEAGLVAVRRAETLTGADWYVAPIGTEPEDLENCFRLEVSGLNVGGRSAIATRLNQKVDQTRRGASNLPAIATVVGFRELMIAIQKVSDGK